MAPMNENCLFRMCVDALQVGNVLVKIDNKPKNYTKISISYKYSQLDL